MFKQEDFNILSASEFNSTANSMENFILNSSPNFDIESINMNDIITLPASLDGNLLSLSPPQQLEDTTMDVATKYEIIEFCPESPRGPPLRTVFNGELDFHVEINASDTNKKKYLYSSQLNRIYVDMKVSFPVSFRWRGAGGVPEPLYVRAAAVFADQSQAEKRVERCTQHTHDATNNDIDPTIVRNVLHSSREIGTHGVYYCGRPEVADSWYSVVVQLPPCPASPPSPASPAALHAHAHAFTFVCKNSCSSGINRRAIDVIFTLEDATGHVYGRQSVGARVCACPRRDMARDQGAAGGGGKRRAAPAAPAAPAPAAALPDKKIKLEVVGVDDMLLTLPPVQIVGVRAMLAGLEVMLHMTEQAASLRRHEAGAAERYARSLAGLRAKIDELKKNHT